MGVKELLQCSAAAAAAAAAAAVGLCHIYIDRQSCPGCINASIMQPISYGNIRAIEMQSR